MVDIHLRNGDYNISVKLMAMLLLLAVLALLGAIIYLVDRRIYQRRYGCEIRPVRPPKPVQGFPVLPPTGGTGPGTGIVTTPTSGAGFTPSPLYSGRGDKTSGH